MTTSKHFAQMAQIAKALLSLPTVRCEERPNVQEVGYRTDGAAFRNLLNKTLS